MFESWSTLRIGQRTTLRSWLSYNITAEESPVCASGLDVRAFCIHASEDMAKLMLPPRLSSSFGEEATVARCARFVCAGRAVCIYNYTNTACCWWLCMHLVPQHS